MFAAGIIVTITNIVIGIVEFLIGLRIILKLFGANPNTPFVEWVYATSDPLLAPFQGIFPSPVLEGQFVLEMSALVALVVYAFIGYIITSTLGYMEALAEERLERSDKRRKK